MKIGVRATVLRDRALAVSCQELHIGHVGISVQLSTLNSWLAVGQQAPCFVAACYMSYLCVHTLSEMVY